MRPRLSLVQVGQRSKDRQAVEALGTFAALGALRRTLRVE